MSDFERTYFLRLGVASVTAESSLRESLESGKIHAKHGTYLSRIGLRTDMELPYLTLVFRKNYFALC
jgi:hypothetical protein